MKTMRRISTLSSQWHVQLVIFILSLLLADTTMAQQGEPADILANIEANYPQEKVYIQTDKYAYNPGETIWFKAYLAADNAPEPFSKNLYAELINEKGQVLQRKMLPVLMAGAANDFIVPDSSNDTRIFIRAYTAWMLNFDSSLLYVKTIQLIPRKIAGGKKANQETPPFSIRFFPEGGDLVAGLSSKVAFKIAETDGTPVNIKGDIVASNNKVVASFAPIHDGMGFFTLQPIAGEQYKAVWKDKAGQRKEVPLPTVKAEGITLAASISNQQLQYAIARPENASEAFTKFTVVAQINQRLVYNAQINLSKKTSVTAPIPIDSLPDGVLQITVFNGLQLPVAERLVFINNNSASFITDIHLVEKNIIRQGRNVVQLDVGGTLLSNLSIAVTDAGINPLSKNESSIFSELLLSADVRGYVYNAAYYFSSDDDSVKQHLDLVMLTNGWRRFKWEALMSGQYPAIRYAPEKSIVVKGNVAGLSSTQLYNKALNGIFKVKENPPAFLLSPVTNKGEFAFDNLYFYDTAKLYYQFTNDKDKTLTGLGSFNFRQGNVKAPTPKPALLDDWATAAKTDTASLRKSATNANLSRQQQSFNKVATLDEVVVVKKQKSARQKMDEEYTSGFFSGGDAYSFSLEDDPTARGSLTLLQYLQGKVAGLQISTNGGGTAMWRGSNTSFFLNETQTDLSTVQNLNMADVALVKVFRPPFFGAAGGGTGGAIAVYLKKGRSSNDAVQGLPFATLIGYSSAREFYSPDYIANPDPTAKDFRTTLYWNPNVHFDRNNRRITLPFFNSDNCKKLRVVVEGINQAGQITREEKFFE